MFLAHAGPLSRPIVHVVAIAPAPHETGVAGTVRLQVRLPRILAAVLIGGGLAASGAAYQGLFRIPMVSPDILGASAGAGFGAAIAILFGFSMITVQLSSFACGLLAVMVAYTIAKSMRGGGDPVLVLVLAGIIVGYGVSRPHQNGG